MVPDAVRWMVEAARQAPSADNTQPWRFCWDGQHLRINFDSVRMEGLTFSANHPATLLSGGAAIENMSQIMMALGKSGIALAVDQPYNKELACVLADPNLNVPPGLAQHPLFGRHTNRLPFRVGPLGQEIKAEISKLCVEGTRLHVFDDVAGMDWIANLVEQASAVRFQTQEVHEWLGKSLRFSPEQISRGDGLDINTLGLPPGGGLFLRFIANWDRMKRLNRLGAYRLLAAMEAGTIRKSSALVSIIGRSNPDGAINAGRLMERVWIELNHRGLAVQPFFVISDQIFRLHDGSVPGNLKEIISKIDLAVSRKLELVDESLYIILRVGHPKSVPVRSKRLPVTSLFSDESK